MIIKTVVVQDFGPYCGKKTIDLAPGDRPVTLIHGENELGKTSFLNAVRWALYGTVFDRRNKPISLVDLLNREAKSNGTYEFSVVLTVDDDGTDYTIYRHASSKSDPTDESDFATDLRVQKGVAFLSREEGAREIQRLLPEDISHFFLFDGEMLGRFEDLVSDATKQSNTIRSSIEQILGVPALENAVTDLSELLTESTRKRDRAAKHVSAAERDAEEVQKFEAKITIAKEDVASIQEQMNERQGQIADVERQLQRHKSVESELAEVLGWRQSRKNAEERIVDLKDERQRLLADAWRDVMYRAVQPRLEELEARRDEISKASRQDAKAALAREQIEVLLTGTDPCPTCHQELHESKRDELQSVLDALPAGPTVDPDEHDRIAVAISRLKKVRAPGAVGQINRIEAEVDKALVERSKANAKIAELELKLREHDEDEVAKLQREKDRLVENKGTILKSIQQAEDRLAMLEQQAAQVRGRIARVSDPELNRLTKEVDLYQGLLDVFRSAIAALRDDLRSVVEQDASDNFMQLTSHTERAGLRINDSYGLLIVNNDGETVTVRSAGAEQIVALSLIGALNKNAVKRGPLIMDTPFGRLDVKHRTNILTFLTQMSDQAVLLVHSGEFYRERDFAVIEPAVQREYELTFVNVNHTDVVTATTSLTSERLEVSSV